MKNLISKILMEELLKEGNLFINENIDFTNKNIVHKLTISKKRLPELILNLVGELKSIKINDQYSIKVHEIKKSNFSAVSGVFYVICTVSQPGHRFGYEEKIVNGKKITLKPSEDVRFELSLT